MLIFLVIACILLLIVIEDEYKPVSSSSDDDDSSGEDEKNISEIDSGTDESPVKVISCNVHYCNSNHNCLFIAS